EGGPSAARRGSATASREGGSPGCSRRPCLPRYGTRLAVSSGLTRVSAPGPVSGTGQVPGGESVMTDKERSDRELSTQRLREADRELTRQLAESDRAFRENVERSAERQQFETSSVGRSRH